MTSREDSSVFEESFDPGYRAGRDSAYEQFKATASQRKVAFERFCRLLGLEGNPPARVLDLACGTGAMAIEFAAHGFKVTGVDIAPTAIEIARDIADREGVEVTWAVADMRFFKEPAGFDLVLLWDVIFGVCPATEDNQRVLENIASSLKPGGKCLLEVYNKEFAMEHGVEDAFFYDAQTDRFDLGEKLPERPLRSVKLYSTSWWETMTERLGLRIVARDGWGRKGDPPAPPNRADYIVVRRS